jgi:DNA-binding NtrC family response regulator
VELYKAIKNIRPELPVVLMTAYSADSLVQEGVAAGAIGVLTKPLNINLLLTFLSSLRRECSVAIVDDDLRFCQTLGGILREQGFTVFQITNPQRVVEQLGRNTGQIVLLDMKWRNKNGLEIFKEIRSQYPHLPVILVTGYGQEMAPAIETALAIEAYTCLYKPIEIEELLRHLTRIRHQELRKILRK